MADRRQIVAGPVRGTRKCGLPRESFVVELVVAVADFVDTDTVCCEFSDQISTFTLAGVLSGLLVCTSIETTASFRVAVTIVVLAGEGRIGVGKTHETVLSLGVASTWALRVPKETSQTLLRL